jgi:hypothetical protein
MWKVAALLDRDPTEPGFLSVGGGAPRRPRAHRIARLTAAQALLAALAWILAHRVPGAGAALADTLRSVAGDRAIAQLEDTVYGVLDEANHLRYANEPPKAEWAPPQPAGKAPAGMAAASAPSQPPLFRPADVGPLHEDFTAPGDGTWVALSAPNAPTATPILYKTLIHPDRERSWAELFVVAIDTSRISLHAVAGTHEPERLTDESKDLAFEGRVPERERGELLAAFNGGFKTRHGHHGMQVAGTTLVAPRPDLCTIVGTTDGNLDIGPWNPDAAQGARFWRQTARCLVEEGVRHPDLVRELTRSWGAAVGGDTVIRRSAIGLDADRSTLYVGVSNSTTAVALAEGMRHAGAHDVAQLDVNQAFPRFLTYEPQSDGTLRAVPLVEGLVYTRDHYVGSSSSRDFFYLTRRTNRVVDASVTSPSAG